VESLAKISKKKTRIFLVPAVLLSHHFPAPSGAITSPPDTLRNHFRAVPKKPSRLRITFLQIYLTFFLQLRIFPFVIPLRIKRVVPFRWLITALLTFITWQSQAKIYEADWFSNGFSISYITINVGDEIDIVNFDPVFDLQLASGPPPEYFFSDIPAAEDFVYYLPVVYNTPGTYVFSDEFGNSVTVTVIATLPPLSVTITSPTNNATFTAPATFAVGAVPFGGATPYAQMDFYVGTNLAGTSYSAPFTQTLTNLPVGNYNITAATHRHPGRQSNHCRLTHQQFSRNDPAILPHPRAGRLLDRGHSSAGAAGQPMGRDQFPFRPRAIFPPKQPIGRLIIRTI
jgi:hypothetical protein